MIIKATILKDEFTHIKNIKMGELAIVLNGSIHNHIVLRCDMGLVSLTDPNVCIHKTTLEQRTMDLSCRILRAEEIVTLTNNETMPSVKKTTEQTNRIAPSGRKTRSYKKIPDEISKGAAYDYLINRLSYKEVEAKYNIASTSIIRCINKHKTAILLAQKRLQEGDIF